CTNSRAWRKLLKKQQRQRRRQRHAKERDKSEAAAQSAREADPQYQLWLQQQAELEEFQRQAAERVQQEQEEAWLRREALAQRQFQLDAAKQRQAQAEAERLRAQQAEELAARLQAQRQRQQERQRHAEQAAAEFEAMMQRMQDYMEDSGTSTPPAELQRVVETHPGERLCEFFTRTNSCRFGHGCMFNHRRPMLARILLIRHFYQHPLLQVQAEHAEYANADAALELSEVDLRADYDEFFGDAIDELQKYGKIVNFRAVRNTLSHLRGHVFVEYTQEKAALRAFSSLQGRYYAARPLSVEFSNLTNWRGAVCGLSLTRKCPKGYSCGYLHLFRNPRNLYNANLESYSTPRSVRLEHGTPAASGNSWNDADRPSRNWRWSESPEPQLERSSSSRAGRDADHKRREQHSRSSCRSRSTSRSR
ncbi:hypothetical protein KR222_000673, partial [Zaprionus bogoriensis]